jgi:hypothetical protein
VITMDNRRDGGGSGDAALLGGIRDLFEVVDPMPPDLPERIRFALALRELEAVVAASSAEAVLAARGTEESRMVTFDSDSLTVMIRIEPNPDGNARVDGWLAPPQRHQVEMRLGDRSITVTADELGRFVFRSVPRGTARLVVHPPAADVAGQGNDDRFSSAESITALALTLLAGE